VITLFYAPHTCSLASHIALEDAAAEYATVRINFADDEQRKPAYLAINPKGRVPALVTDRGILTETPAMLAFIAQSFPQARLAPLGDPFFFAEVQAFNSYLCSTLHVAHAHRMRGNRWADDPAAIAAMQRKVPESVSSCYDLIERKMLREPWVMGETYTICDPCYSPWHSGWNRTAWMLPDFPKSCLTDAGCPNGRRFKRRLQRSSPEPNRFSITDRDGDRRRRESDAAAGSPAYL
jgi:glutathione S-transferase